MTKKAYQSFAKMGKDGGIVVNPHGHAHSIERGRVLFGGGNGAFVIGSIHGFGNGFLSVGRFCRILQPDFDNSLSSHW
jgi:hypothetical protein